MIKQTTTTTKTSSVLVRVILPLALLLGLIVSAPVAASDKSINTIHGVNETPKTELVGLGLYH